jgi:hypothetical protein
MPFTPCFFAQAESVNKRSNHIAHSQQMLLFGQITCGEL